MDLLLILTYTAVCIAIFKIFKIPLNKWTVPTAVLGGIVLIGALILLMNYNHPYSEIGRQYFVTTPIVPNVSGQVVEVPVEPNQLLETGDVLFRIDPLPYQYKVDSLKARVQAAKSELERVEKLVGAKAASQRDLDLLQIRLLSLQKILLMFDILFFCRDLSAQTIIFCLHTVQHFIRLFSLLTV